ncbi:MAG TPA: hypothetical protein DCP91_10630 [Eggerthellaceae bacterium]|nr:hypothetical protein [Eggerthellaceae bacterium]
MVPQVLANRYRVLEGIGSGGMARVYRGFDENLRRPVAVKIMKPELAAQAGFVKQFELEARSAARLNDPCIVGVYDWGFDQSNCFIVMELVDGFDVRTILHWQGDLFPQAAARIARQVCRALEVAHGYGIIHSDVKPSNILLARTGAVKMVDFGIAQMGRGKVGGKGAVGTVRYMSPEQARGETLDRRSDVYSLGVTLYEMCGGMREGAYSPTTFGSEGPSGGALAPSWSYRPLSEANPEFDADFDGIIETCIEADPAKRFATAGKLAEALQGYLDDHEPADAEVLGRDAPAYWTLTFVTDENRTANSIRIDEPATIGRSSEADIQIPALALSGMHAAVEPKGAFLVVEDLGSLNGTYLNGLPIYRRVYCRPGDMVKLGETRLQIGCECQ